MLDAADNEKSENEEGDNENPGDGWEGWEVASMSGSDQGSWEEASDDGEEVEGEEEDANSGSDEENEDSDDEEDPETQPSPAKKPKTNIAMERILTDEDFKKLRKLKQRKEYEKISGDVQDNSDLELSSNSEDEDDNVKYD